MMKTNNKMWSGRFKQESAKLLEEFNASIFFDNKLYKYDIKGSISHVKMLEKQQILTKDESLKIQEALKKIEQEIDEEKFEFNISQEDIHMAIEQRLIQMIGDVGGKLHTARSRNDQVALDFRMFVLDKNQEIANLILNIIATLLDIAKKHKQTLLPGMTHLQHAQPISFAYHMLAYASMFKRDYERFISSIKRNNYSPLGCAALAGTPHNIDRDFSAKSLGFKSATINCLDSVSDRDFALEILFNISTLFMHISRLSEELIIWSSSEFSYITISDEYSTGSSIMPNKKNPDVAELLRGKTGRVYGNLISLLTVMKSLPLAYNKDMQEDKEGVFDSVENTTISLQILNEMLKTMTINVNNMLKATKKGHLSATDLADYLVKKGIPFREAHFITGKAVGIAEEKNIDLSELDIESLKNLNQNIQDDIQEFLDLKNSMNARKSFGATSVKSVEEQIRYFDDFLQNI